MLTIRGKIIFSEGKVPESIPDGSVLTVQFQDTSRADASAIDLGKCVQVIKGYTKGQELSFEIKDAKKPDFPEATMSAVINIGWSPSKNEWIRKKDYLNDTTHRIDILPNKIVYEGCDVEVIKYE